MRVHLQPSDDRPLYVQVMDEVRRGLVRGTLGPDDALPSVRELASSLRINPRTVSQAYLELEREGLVRILKGKGTFVAPEIRPDRNGTSAPAWRGRWPAARWPTRPGTGSR